MPGSRWKSFKLAAMAHNRSSPSPRPTESKAGNSRSSRSQLKEANGPPAIRWPLYPAFRTASASPQNSRARLVNTIDRPVISGPNATICDTANAVSRAELNDTISAWCPLRSRAEAMYRSPRFSSSSAPTRATFMSTSNRSYLGGYYHLKQLYSKKKELLVLNTYCNARWLTAYRRATEPRPQGAVRHY